MAQRIPGVRIFQAVFFDIMELGAQVDEIHVQLSLLPILQSATLIILAFAIRRKRGFSARLLFVELETAPRTRADYVFDRIINIWDLLRFGTSLRMGIVILLLVVRLLVGLTILVSAIRMISSRHRDLISTTLHPKYNSYNNY